MDRLLNIKEASEFLNVSEMSIRRWTNKGSLKCFRVGGKKERRFYMNDLIAFLNKDSEDAREMVPLGFDDLKLSFGGHVSHFFANQKEFFDTALKYTLTGLNSGESVLLAMPRQKHEDFLSLLATYHPSLKNDLKTDRLVISEGKNSPEEMIRHLDDFVKNTKKFRIMGDMSWAVDKGWDLETIRELEQAPVLSRPIKNGVLVCQYGLNEFSGGHIMMAIESHKEIIYKGAMGISPYYHINGSA